VLSPHRLADSARAWAQAHAPGPITEIAGVGAGITNTKWRLRLADGESLVLRWSDPEIWGATGKDHVRREAMACELLATSTVPVPRLIAIDPDGATAGGPASLMGWQPGRTRHDRLSPAAVTALAELTVAVHSTPVPAEQRPPEFSYRGPAAPEVPSWSRRPELWRRAIEFRRAGTPATPYGWLHRDFHLGNLLWQGDTITGLIDWTDACWGPPDLDVAHLCSDLAMLHPRRLHRSGRTPRSRPRCRQLLDRRRHPRIPARPGPRPAGVYRRPPRRHSRPGALRPRRSAGPGPHRIRSIFPRPIGSGPWRA
jgi:aminoglycoside phosphotransferase (APT) family kinase protein